jgi:hypothetical protein
VLELHGWELNEALNIRRNRYGSGLSSLTSRKIHDANEIEPKTPDRASLVVNDMLACDMAAVAHCMLVVFVRRKCTRGDWSRNALSLLGLE